MAGSIDLNTNRGILTIIGIAVLAGGGASTLKDQVFGPGGDWEEVVTNQAVQAEQIKNIDTRFKELTIVLKDGFEKIAATQDDYDDDMETIRSHISNNAHRIDMNNIELAELRDMLNRILQEE